MARVKHTTRRAPHMERYVEVKPTRIRGKRIGGWTVTLKVRNQSFIVVNATQEFTRSEARWLRDMLCIALDRIVTDEGARIDLNVTAARELAARRRSRVLRLLAARRRSRVLRLPKPLARAKRRGK